MIRYFAILLLLPLSLLASKILSYNIYDRTDRADVMITFDTPFSGKITQSTTDTKIIIKLEGASIESPKIKNVNSEFLRSLSITPMANQTQLVATVPLNIKLMASKTSDGYGLRLRFKTQDKISQNENVQKQQPSLQNPFAALPTKKDEGVSQSYYIVVGFLLIATMVLFYFKRKIQKNQNTPQQNNWLFKSNQEQSPAPVKHETSTMSQNEVSIRFQKAINSENNVVMLDFANQSYLVLMGKSNILLDKFTDNIPTTEQEFQSILQSRHEQLEEFLGEKGTATTKEPLQAYKERAASMLYNEEA